MHRAFVVLGLAIVGATLGAGFSAHAQEDAAAEHAKRIVDLLAHEHFDEVAHEFNAQMAAALPATQLAAVWRAVQQQIGAFRSCTDQNVRPQSAVTAVMLGCQFEKSAANVMVAFDGDGKIGGLRIVPRPVSQPPAAPPASSRFTEESVTVGADDWKLPATLSMPAGRVIGAVVLVHGSGPNDRDETIGANHPFRDLAWGLADRGVAVLRYEKRTHQYPQRAAAIKNLTVRDEVIDDALRAVALLRAHDRIDPKRVFVLGHSLGGTLAPRIAGDDRTIAGLIIMAGATRPFEQVAREQIDYLASIAPESAPADRDAALRMLMSAAPPSYWNNLNAYKPAETAATLTMPMLILQGERDYQVTLDDLRGWRDALAGHSNVAFKTYPALNHLFLAGEGKSTPAEYLQPGHIPDQVLNDITRWVEAH